MRARHTLAARGRIGARLVLLQRTATTGLAVLALLGASLAASVPASAATSPVVPIADSYVDDSKPDRNYGKSQQLRVDGEPVRTSYLKFDIADLSRTSGAMLRIYVESENNDSVGVELRSVADDSWTEGGITARNAPAVGALLDSTGPLRAESYYYLDATGALSGDSTISLALTSSARTAVRISSREGPVSPELFLPPPPAPTRFVVQPLGGGVYESRSDTGNIYTGTVKDVVENAVHDLGQRDGGTVAFTAGDFDLGPDYFMLRSIQDIVFEGAGMDATFIHNSTDEAGDTEPFNISGADRVTIRDLHVAAGGAARTTSDAIDLDQGNDSVVERVRISQSRGRGIVIDGKNDTWTADGNVVRDCVITGTASKGIELLASSGNLIEGCVITDVGGAGIQVNKASSQADQPNKKSSDNVIRLNTVLRAGHDGISVNSGDRNLISGNQVTNSSTLTSGRDGIRIMSTDGITAEDNVVSDNVATDDRSEKLQSYGLKIASTACLRTVVSGNDFRGNRLGDVYDAGTGTKFL